MSITIRRLARVMVCVLFYYGLTGCAAAPIAEFKAYRDVFDEARRAGEEVLFSYAAARDKVLRPKTLQPGPARPKVLPARVATNGDEVIHLMAGWDAVSAYNEFVASIIEGKAESEVQALYAGYQSIAASLPIKAAGAIAAATGPWSAAIEQAIQLLDHASRRRRFVKKLKEGGLVVQAILSLHADNADMMFDAQYLANESEYASVANGFRAAAKDLAVLLETYKFENEQDIIADINRTISTFPAAGPDQDLKAVALSRSAEQAANAEIVRLEWLRGKLYKNHAAALSLTDKLNDHIRLLVCYRELVHAAQEKLRQAVIAAAGGKQQLPDTTDLRRLVVQVRKALILKNERG